MTTFPADLKPSDPRGKCVTCRHFIDSTEEIIAEIKHRTGVNPVLRTAERKGKSEVRPALFAMGLVEAIEKRLGVPLRDVGLCEIGVADFAHRPAGGAVNGEGKRIDPCPEWEAMDERGEKMRSAFWRMDRDREKAARAIREQAGGGAPAREILAGDPCPCGSGKLYGDCCGRGRTA